MLVGALAGWLAGLIVHGGGFGFLANMIVGIVGAAIAGFVLPRMGYLLGHGLVGELIRATIGAIILLVVLSLVPRLRR